MKNIILTSLTLFLVSLLPWSFAWDGQIAMDADKRNVKIGEIITYQGYIYGDFPIEGELVSISVYEKESRKTVLTADTSPEKKSVEYFDNTAWSFTFQVGTSFKEFSTGKTYVVEAKYAEKSAKLEFFIQSEKQPSCLDQLDGMEIMVFTDKENYDKGDTIRISGCLSEIAFTNEINVSVYDPEGNIVGVSTINPDSDRTFSEDFVIDDKFGIEGTYLVEVDSGGLYSSSKSFVVPEFGTIAVAILLVAVATFVLISSNYTKILPKL